MRSESRLSPRKLALLSFGGAALLYLEACGAVFFSSLSGATRRPQGWAALADALWFVAPACLALWAMLYGQGSLRRGVTEERWSPALLNETRSYLQSRTLRLLSYGSVLMVLAWIIFDLFWRWSHHPHSTTFAAFSYFLIAPVTTLSQLRAIVAAPVAQKPVRWDRDLKPVSSAQWGNRGLT